MSIIAAAIRFDLPIPLSFTEEGETLSSATNEDALFISARTLVNYRRREWVIEIPYQNKFAIERVESLHSSTFYGVLPILFTPPGEATEIEVFMNMQRGTKTDRTSNRLFSVRITLTESK